MGRQGLDKRIREGFHIKDFALQWHLPFATACAIDFMSGLPVHLEASPAYESLYQKQSQMAVLYALGEKVDPCAGENDRKTRMILLYFTVICYFS